MPEFECLIKAVGDICPGDYSIRGAGICSLTKKYGTGFLFEHVENEFRHADIVLGNFEGILSAQMLGASQPEINFCGIPEFSKTLKSLGFNVVNVANNHVLDQGKEKFFETVHTLQKSGIQICGLRDTGRYYSKPVFVEKQGKKIGILGYNWVGKDKHPDTDQYISQSHDSVVNYTWERENQAGSATDKSIHLYNRNVIEDIKKLKEEVDFLVLTTHWGYEFVDRPPHGVVMEARAFIDAGADLIIGGHPHVLQGMEMYEGKWIFYSLGNFIFDMRADLSKKSVILEYQIRDHREDVYSLTHISINRRFQPMREAKTDRIETMLRQSSHDIRSSESARLLEDNKIYKEYEREYQKRKFHNILQHFRVILRNPRVGKVMVQKGKNALALIKMRFQGKKVRW